MLQRTLRAMGVHLHLETATTAILGDDARRGPALRRRHEARLRPRGGRLPASGRTWRSRVQAGLAVDRGIVVGDDLATSDDRDVYAIGECARAPRPASTGWSRRSGTRPACSPSGSAAPGRTPRTRLARRRTKLKVMEVELAVMGERDADARADEVVQVLRAGARHLQEAHRPRRAARRRHPARRRRHAPALLQAFDRGDAAARRPVRAALPAAPARRRRRRVQALPHDAQVCNCNGVSKGRSSRRCRAGAAR